MEFLVSKLFPFLLIYLFMMMINQNEVEFSLIFVQHAVFQRLKFIPQDCSH